MQNRGGYCHSRDASEFSVNCPRAQWDPPVAGRSLLLHVGPLIRLFRYTVGILILIYSINSLFNSFSGFRELTHGVLELAVCQLRRSHSRGLPSPPLFPAIAF